MAAGFESVSVLDVSATAQEQAKRRLVSRAAQVTWLVADVTQIADVEQFDVWHDRAVYHFLTEPEDRRKYVDLATRSIRVGGHLILGTFALDGPPTCSGLNICRYDAATLSHELGPRFQLVKELRRIHVTPAGNTQPFFFGLFERLT